MNNDIIKTNLIALRKNHNLSADQVSSIANITVEEYKKMELGLIEFPFEVIDKLATFYNVDIVDIANKMLNEKPQAQQNAEESTNEKEKNSEPATYSKSKAKSNNIFNIFTLVGSSILLIFYLFVPLANFEIGGLTGSVYFYNLFNSSNVLYVLLAFFGLIVPIWLITNSIIMLASKSLIDSTYSKVGKIVNIVSTSLLVLFTCVLITKIPNEAPKAVPIIYFLTTVLTLLNCVLSLALKIKNVDNLPKTTKLFNILSLIFTIAALVAYFTIPFVSDGNKLFSDNLFKQFSIQHLGFSDFITIFSDFAFLSIIWMIINGIILLVSEYLKQSKYGKASKIVDIVCCVVLLISPIYILVQFSVVTFDCLVLPLFSVLTLIFNILALKNRKKLCKSSLNN